MDKIVVQGGNPLRGAVSISGAKNAVLPILASTLLTRGRNQITNAPKVKDVNTMLELIRDLGGTIESWKDGEVAIDTEPLHKTEARYDLVATMRASCLVLGPLVARLGEARVSLPGGCAIGARPIDLHIKGLEALGAEIHVKEGYIHARAKTLKGAHYCFDTVSVTGTQNLLMAAALAEGETVLENAAREPEVAFLADVLNQSGAKIEGAGTDTVTINGVSALEPIECRIFPDRIEAATYLIAGAITGGEIEVQDCLPNHVEPVVLKLREAGVTVQTSETTMYVKANGAVKSANIRTQPHPGFPTDVQAQFMALMTLAEGQSVIMETVFENRFMHAAELNRLGADILIEGHTAVIRGVKGLSGSPVMATDLRASASLVLAALAAKGETIISRVYHIDRGYVSMEKKLSNLGATIKRVK
ncbi:MAG: UDP-N-acetylglucosamine 1-carboxyvinyltransferase [Candidatus Nitronauta litoralis]|uniref:UDP-N-acetylglucosamine 1-carboxyvinyltransferase n=1 Tax=Candidatus Nitronauta litoralis TaxID=2705533 RepID=A0A7T0BW55_9BACT|nr:MAG: UDP-N-acetylglucosamine 1-carboxyvinyltransferase [Candidatus Nitronauta litoralis]